MSFVMVGVLTSVTANDVGRFDGQVRVLSVNVEVSIGGGEQTFSMIGVPAGCVHARVGDKVRLESESNVARVSVRECG